MEEKIYQGHVYRRPGPGQPWQLVGPAQQEAQPRGRVIADPYKPAQERRAEQDQGFQAEGIRISRENAARQAHNDAESSARSRASDSINNPQSLRKEYGSLPEVKEYKMAAQMAAAALATDDSPQGDIALTYAFAKAMDPTSVVRDQEQAMLTNSQPWFQTAVEGVKKQFGMDGTGNFTPDARRRIRLEIIRNLSSRRPLYDARRAEMTDVARVNQIDPAQVVGKDDTSVFADAFRSYAEKHGDDGDVIYNLIGGDPIKAKAPKAAGYGATVTSVPVPEEMQKAHSDYVAKHWGKIDPQDYAAFRINLDKKYGFGSDAEGYAKSVPELNKAAAEGRSSLGNQIPAMKKELSAFDQFRNNILSNPAGAGVANALNSASLGVPSLAAPAQMQAIREEFPKSSFVGEIAGGVGGTKLAGMGLKAAARSGENAVARALATPLAADVGYGAAYGATQAEDPLYGAVGGGLAGLLGNRAGSALGRSFPSATGARRAITAADQAVPSSDDLRALASDLYAKAEATGARIGGDETLALADNASNLLSSEGRLSPTGRLTEVQPKVKEAYGLIQDYAGEEMSPQAVQTVRRVIGDGLSSADGSERRIAKLLMGEFDGWTDGVAPELASGLAEARGVSSRYLQGDKIAQARELADVRAGQFSNSGTGNALRTDFRGLDRAIAKGQENFSPAVESAISEVARGTRTSNVLRNIGRFAPTGPVSAVPMLLAAGGGGAVGGPAGALALPALMAGGGFAARGLSNYLTDRAAQVAEKLAYGGGDYEQAILAALTKAETQGGHAGAILSTDIARLLSDKAGY